MRAEVAPVAPALGWAREWGGGRGSEAEFTFSGWSFQTQVKSYRKFINSAPGRGGVPRHYDINAVNAKNNALLREFEKAYRVPLKLVASNYCGTVLLGKLCEKTEEMESNFRTRAAIKVPTPCSIDFAQRDSSGMLQHSVEVQERNDC